MKAFGYLRVSGASQVEGDGPERQELAIRKHAEANGIEIERVFFDGGISGKTEWENRPAWVSMLKAIADNGVRTIIVERLDRVARDLMVQEHIISDLQRRGVTLISAKEPDMCASDPSRKMFRQILGIFAEYDRAMLVVKMRAAKDRMKARGERAEGAFAYGEHPAKPEEKEVLEWMRQSYRNGASLTLIANTLNANGVPPRRGRQWHANAVARIVRRPVRCQPVAA